MDGVTQYSGLAGLYFHYLLSQIIRVGRLTEVEGKILDFGCGMGQLKRRLGGTKVIGFDRVPGLGDVQDWRVTDFDVLVSNQVFYCFNEADLNALLDELRLKSPNLRLIVGISRQGVLNNLGKHLLRRPNAHSRTQIAPAREIEILQQHCTVIRKKNVLCLADIYVLKFNHE